MDQPVPSPATILACSAGDLDRRLDDFAEVLHACVRDGASVGFVLPYGRAEAAAFWREKIRPPLAAGGRLLLAAEADGRLAGTVQLIHDTLPNQPHRAEVSKLLVHPDFRRRGIARALMAELEHRARGMRRTLLTLDTRTGDDAERLYTALGFRTTGVIPGWCLHTEDPTRLDDTTIMYKTL